MNSKFYFPVGALLALTCWLPAQSWASCNTNASQTGAVSAYALSGQGNFSCAALNMVNATANTIPPALGVIAIDWVRTDPQEVDVVAVADSSGKRCVYNYGPGATGGSKLTPNSANNVSQVLYCKDGNVIPPPNAAPVVSIQITAPAPPSPIKSDITVTFAGTASDTKDGNLSQALVWTSSLDGFIGGGSSISTTLTAGTHNITAQVEDSGGLLGSAQITLIVDASVVSQCQSVAGGASVLINGTAVTCPTDGSGNLLPRVVCSADISDDADQFELSQQGCCVCGATAVECNPDLPAVPNDPIPAGAPGPCPVAKAFDNLQVPTTILFNNDPYYCTTTGGRRTCYAY